MNKGDYIGMKSHMSHINWDVLLNEEQSVDVWWDAIEKVLNEAKELFVPKKKLHKHTATKASPHYKQPSYTRTFAAPDSMFKK